MSTAFLTYKKFHDPALATFMAERLDLEGIDYIVEKEPLHYDPLIVGQTSDPLIHLKIAGDQFERANAILEKYYEQQLTDVDPDYYLLTFTDAELIEILSKPDEWGPFDYVLAKKLLTDRGHDITGYKKPLPKAREAPASAPSTKKTTKVVFIIIFIALALFVLFYFVM